MVILPQVKKGHVNDGSGMEHILAGSDGPAAAGEGAAATGAAARW